MITVHDLRHVDADVAEAWLSEISENLRQSDIDEVTAMGGVSPSEALKVSVALSTHAYVVMDKDGNPVAAFGAAPHPLPGVGIVWMLGTDGVRREAYSIAKQTRRYFEELQAAYFLLWNYIDARNTASMRWLKWGGFTLLKEHPNFGPEGRTFFTFARTAAT